MLFRWRSTYVNSVICASKVQLTQLTMNPINLFAQVFQVQRQAADLVEFSSLTSGWNLLLDQKGLLLKNNKTFSEHFFFGLKCRHDTAATRMGRGIDLIELDGCQCTIRATIWRLNPRRTLSMSGGMLQHLGQRFQGQHVNVQKTGSLLENGLLKLLLSGRLRGKITYATSCTVVLIECLCKPLANSGSFCQLSWWGWFVRIPWTYLSMYVRHSSFRDLL